MDDVMAPIFRTTGRCIADVGDGYYNGSGYLDLSSRFVDLINWGVPDCPCRRSDNRQERCVLIIGSTVSLMNQVKERVRSMM